MFLVVLAYAAVAALQILVWNPLATVPGMNLAQIRADMAEANEHLHLVPVIAFLISGGDSAPWGGVLVQFSLGSLMAFWIVVAGPAIWRAIRGVVRRRPGR